MSQKRVVVKAVAATAACSVVLAGIFFYFLYRFFIARQLKKSSKDSSSFRRETAPVVTVQEDFRGHGGGGGTLKGLIVDENGRDVLYLRKSDGASFTSCFSKVWFNPITEEEEEEKRIDDRGDKPGISSPIQEIPLLLHQPFHVNNFEGLSQPAPVGHQINNNTVPKTSQISRQKFSQLPQTPLVVTPPPPPPPPLVKAQTSPQPPPPPLPSGNFLKPSSLLNPIKTKTGIPPPPPPKSSGVSSVATPPVPPRGKTYEYRRTEASMPEYSDDKGEIRMKLKPLHWDKVATNVEHSVVWNEINDGSFR